jgi:hypothetical protein
MLFPYTSTDLENGMKDTLHYAKVEPTIDDPDGQLPRPISLMSAERDGKRIPVFQECGSRYSLPKVRGLEAMFPATAFSQVYGRVLRCQCCILATGANSFALLRTNSCTTLHFDKELADQFAVSAKQCPHCLKKEGPIKKQKKKDKASVRFYNVGEKKTPSQSPGPTSIKSNPLSRELQVSIIHDDYYRC